MKKSAAEPMRKKSFRAPANSSALDACYGAIPDDDVSALLTCLLGSNIKTVVSDIEGLDLDERKELFVIAMGAAIGGTKVVDGLATRHAIRKFEGTCFVIDKKLNTSALVMAGHYLIRIRANPRITDAFAAKYGAQDIWHMPEDEHTLLSQDCRIKLEFAKKHTFDERNAHELARLVAETYGRELPSFSTSPIGISSIVSPMLSASQDMEDVTVMAQAGASGPSGTTKDYSLRSKSGNLGSQ